MGMLPAEKFLQPESRETWLKREAEHRRGR